jgi:hypothetical protein
VIDGDVQIAIYVVIGVLLSLWWLMNLDDE